MYKRIELRKNDVFKNSVRPSSLLLSHILSFKFLYVGVTMNVYKSILNTISFQGTRSAQGGKTTRSAGNGDAEDT